jgi:hypothetical protein
MYMHIKIKMDPKEQCCECVNLVEQIEYIADRFIYEEPWLHAWEEKVFEKKKLYPRKAVFVNRHNASRGSASLHDCPL